MSLLAGLWLAVAGVFPSAAEVVIHAQINKTSVALNDQLVLEVSVSGPHATLPDPVMPPLKNFSLYSSGSNQSLSFVNGKVSSSLVHTYVLVPRFVGKGVIDPITVTVDGVTARTAPIEITVQPPNSAPAGSRAQGASSPRQAPQTAGGAPAPDVFVTAELDKPKAFVNEQATLTVRFHTGVTLLGNPQYNAPKIAGFLAEDLPPERHGTVSLKGRQYYFSEIKTALFPAQAGTLRIGKAMIRCEVQQDVAIDPFAPDFFQKFFSQGLVGAQARELVSEPLTLTAEPLPPEGKPPGFSGAVGRFGVSAAVDRSRVKAGDAVNLTVTVSGTGNLKAAGEPRLPELPAFRVYDTVSGLNIDKKGDVVQGSKVFRTVLVPKVSGTLEIPPVTYSYFDPEKRRYLEASTLPIRLAVEPGAAGSGPSAVFQGPAAAAPQGLTPVTRDIRYLKTAASAPAATRLLEAVAAGGAAHSVPFLLFAGVLSFLQFREHSLADPKAARFRRALKSAQARIRAAQRPQEGARAAQLLAEALTHFLADKLDLPASGLTLRGAQDILRRRTSLDPGLADRVKELWEELDLRRFAPSTPGAGRSEEASLSKELSALLKELEKQWS